MHKEKMLEALSYEIVRMVSANSALLEQQSVCDGALKPSTKLTEGMLHSAEYLNAMEGVEVNEGTNVVILCSLLSIDIAAVQAAAALLVTLPEQELEKLPAEARSVILKAIPKELTGRIFKAMIADESQG